MLINHANGRLFRVINISLLPIIPNNQDTRSDGWAPVDNQ